MFSCLRIEISKNSPELAGNEAITCLEKKMRVNASNQITRNM